MSPFDENFMTKSALLIRVRDGEDPLAWDEFVRFYWSFIYTIIRHRGFNHQDTEEITQNVLVNLWRIIPKFLYNRRKGRFRGWITEVVKNNIKDFLRKKKKYHKDYYLTPSKVGETADSWEESLKEEIDQEWKSFVTRKAWRNIASSFDKKTRTCFAEFLRGKSGKEIAEKLNISLNSVYVNKKRFQDRFQDEVRRINRMLV